MPNYGLFCTVCSDGVGDFSHLSDILKKLGSDPKYSDVKFKVFVNFEEGGTNANYQRIQEQVNQLQKQFNQISIYYGKTTDHEQFRLNDNIVQELNTLDQAILVSYGGIISNWYQPYFKPGIPLKSIDEHEKRMASWDCSITQYEDLSKNGNCSLVISSTGDPSSQAPRDDGRIVTDKPSDEALVSENKP